MDEHGFRPLKKTYRPKAQAIPAVDKEPGIEQPSPLRALAKAQQPTTSVTLASPLPSNDDEQWSEPSQSSTDDMQQNEPSQPCVDVLPLQVPRLALRHEHVLSVRNGFDVLSVEQDGNSNNIVLRADPICEDD